MRKGTGVSTNPRQTVISRLLLAASRRRSVRIGVAIGTVAVLAVLAYAVLQGAGKNDQAVPTATVIRGPLTISVIESGNVSNREQAIIKNEVEGMTTILSIVPEGTNVKKGDLLVELDSSQLVDQRVQQQITVMNAEAAYIRARESLAVTKSQNDSDIAKAELTSKFAQQDLTKYMEGEHPRDVQKAEADITIAKEELQRADDKVNWSEQLAADGYITRTELEADKLAKKKAQIDLDLAQGALQLLNQYTHQRNLDQLKSDQEQAAMALERTKRKAAADLVQAEAELKAKESEYSRQKDKLEKLNQQIAKCRLTAPVDGMVVYATTGKPNFRGSTEPIEEGRQVREREEIIYLPTTAEMTAEVKVHEASLRKVRAGMPVRLTVDALPGKVFWGKVSKIGLLPDAQAVWMNPDLKVYNTQIEIEGDAGELRPGMSCRAEIVVEQYADCLYVPVQSVVRVGGKPVVYVRSSKTALPREVEVGLDNGRMMHIVGGLKDGESVLLAPPLAPSAIRDESGPQVPTGLPEPGHGQQTATSMPAGEPTSRPAFDMSKLRTMSSEERRQFFENLPAEQREQLRAMMRTQGGTRGGQGEPAAPGGQGRSRRRADPSGSGND